MKKCIIIIFSILILISCTHNNKAGSENIIRDEVMNIAIKYAGGKLKDAIETVAKDGIVTISDKQSNFVTPINNQITYLIDPAKILVGTIDDDNDEDAIITLQPLKGQYQEMPEILILIKRDGKLTLNRVIESDMKILGIKDRVITAEILTRSRNSPLRDCNACKEVAKYQFKTGDLVRIE